MPPRQGLLATAMDRAKQLRLDVAREFKQLRLDRSLTQQRVGEAIGVSASWVSRFEAGRIDPDLRRLTLLFAVVGYKATFRAYPLGQPVRDAAHLDLLEHLAGLLDASLRLAREVPLPVPGDLRAWDGMIVGLPRRIGVEAETRPRDMQALERRIALKQRDSGIDVVILVLRNSRANRDLVRTNRHLLERFSVPGARALASLAAGKDPGGSAIVLL